MDRRRLALVVIGVVAVAAIGWWFLLRSAAPPAPDLASAVETASAAQTGSTVATSTTVTHSTTSSAYETTTTTQAPVATTAPTTTTAVAVATTAPTTTTAVAVATTVPATTTAVAAASTAGTWAVDTDIGSFSDFTSTWVGYRVQEVLGNGIGSATAVGRTPLVVGSVVLTDDAIEAVEVTADLRGLRSDKVYRDGKVRSALHTGDHPTATFALLGPVTLGDLDGDGVSVDAVVPGTITINGMTGPVEVTLAATLVGDVVTVVGSFPIVFADHGIEAPGASIVVSVEDHGIVEFQLFLTR